MCSNPYNLCLLIWVAKLETSHVLQSNKNKIYRGGSDCLSVSISQNTIGLPIPQEYLFFFVFFEQLSRLSESCWIVHKPPIWRILEIWVKLYQLKVANDFSLTHLPLDLSWDRSWFGSTYWGKTLKVLLVSLFGKKVSKVAGKLRLDRSFWLRQKWT